MKKLNKLLRRLLTKEHRVYFYGKEHVLTSSRFKRSKESAQEYTDLNAVACGCCGEIMFPGEKLWLCIPSDTKKFEEPGVLIVGEGKDRSLVACLRWTCAETAAVMCGDLLSDRKVQLFESPIQRMMRTNDVVIISDVANYHG